MPGTNLVVINQDSDRGAERVMLRDSDGRPERVKSRNSNSKAGASPSRGQRHSLRMSQIQQQYQYPGTVFTP